MEENPMIAWADKLKALRDRKAELEAEIKQINMISAIPSVASALPYRPAQRIL